MKWTNPDDMQRFQMERYRRDPIKDKDGNPLSVEECCEYEDDVWDVGIPGSAAGFYTLWDKWGERLGIAKPEGYDEWSKTTKK